jgi:transposase
MKPLSKDLRARILDAVDNREGSRRALAARFKVNVSTITRLLPLRRQTGSSDPRPHGGGNTPTLDQRGLQRLRALVRKDPDATLETLRQRLGVDGSIMIVWRALKKLAITVKKKSRQADERDRPDVPRQRRRFRKAVKAIDPKRLVFGDETGVTTAMTPAYGRAPRGQRVIATAPASWESVTLTAAVALDGPRAPLALPGATHEAAFRASLEEVLAPALRPGDVVVFDNLAAHLKPGIAEAIERAGASVLPLPP